MVEKLAVFAVCVGGYILMLFVTYRKGRSDERFRQLYCSDCGCDREQDGICHDCRLKLYGEQLEAR